MTILNKETLAIIMAGTTHVIDMGGKNAFIHYETGERAHMLLPDGTRFHGQWRLLDDGYKVEWQDGPTGVWKLDHAPGAIDYVDATGAARGRVSRIDFGDTASLAV
ncbi:MAG: hypothetical protein ABIQ51_14910 [Mesorhizobium sp.]